MMKFKITIVFLILTISLMAQEKRFISGEQAVEWAPRLIGMNFQVIGENNEKGIDSTEIRQIEYLFITDEKEKADSLIEKIKTSYEYKVYKLYFLEERWIVTGLTTPLSMEFDSFSKWTFDFFKFGFDEDCKLLNWNFPDENQTAKINSFWSWFVENQEEYYNMDIEKMEEIEVLFVNLEQELKKINKEFTFEFSPVLENGKMEFILSAEGIRDSFGELLSLFKQSPELEKWEVIPFRQGFDEDPKLKFNNGFELNWDMVKFEFEEKNAGLSIDFYIKDYDERNGNFGMALVILLDSYLGEYDAVTQIRYVDLHKLTKKKAKKLKEFKSLKKVVEDYKLKKYQTQPDH